MEYALALVLFAAVVAVVLSPIVRGQAEGDPAAEGRRNELEAAKEAKYREIRDAELDHRMGKLGDDEWRDLDRELRGEAIEILKRLDSLGENDDRPPTVGR